VENNVFDNVRRKDGVLVEHSPYGIVAGNSISLVPARGTLSQKGVSIRGSQGMQVFGNDVQGASTGILIATSPVSLLLFNTASANRADGFKVGSHSDDIFMAGNAASGNGGWGFRVDSDRVVLEDNAASTNDDGGFSLKDDNAVVSGNTAASNDGTGFLISGDALDIRQNSATDNSDYGFDVSSSAPDLTVADLLSAGNTASGNQHDFRVD